MGNISGFYQASNDDCFFPFNELLESTLLVLFHCLMAVDSLPAFRYRSKCVMRFLLLKGSFTLHWQRHFNFSVVAFAVTIGHRTYLTMMLLPLLLPQISM